MFKTIEQVKNKEKGFSLLELSVAVGIAAIVAAVAITATTVFVNGASTAGENYQANASDSVADSKASFDALWGEGEAPNSVGEYTGGEGGVGDGAITPSVGKIFAWGWWEGVPTDTLEDIVAISASQESWGLAVRSNGTVVSWGGYGNPGFVPEELTNPETANVISVAAGAFHGLALRSNGTVVAWAGTGTQANPLAYSVPPGLSGVVAIAAGGHHSLALKSDGTVVAWGKNGDSNGTIHSGGGQSTVPEGLSGVIAISAGDSHSVALKSDGTVVTWGGSNWGNPAVPAGLTGVIAIDTGWDTTFALKSDGTVVSWGYEIGAPPANATGIIAIAGGGNHIFALKEDGTLIAWGSNWSGEATIPNILPSGEIIAISAGAEWNMILIKNN